MCVRVCSSQVWIPKVANDVDAEVKGSRQRQAASMCCRSQSLSYIASGGECLLCNLKAHVFGRMIVAYNRGEEFLFHTTLYEATTVAGVQQQPSS